MDLTVQSIDLDFDSEVFAAGKYQQIVSLPIPSNLLGKYIYFASIGHSLRWANAPANENPYDLDYQFITSVAGYTFGFASKYNNNFVPIRPIEIVEGSVVQGIFRTSQTNDATYDLEAILSAEIVISDSFQQPFWVRNILGDPHL